MMLPLDKSAAIDKVLAPRSRSRVTIKGPSLGADYVADSADPTVMGAVEQVLHEFAMRTNRNLLTEISEVRWVAVHRDDTERVVI